MKTALNIAKFAPAVLCGLLVVAWVVSGFGAFGIMSHSPGGLTSGGNAYAGLRYGSVVFAQDANPFISVDTFEGEESPTLLGRFRLLMSPRFAWSQPQRVTGISLPLPFLLTLLLPFAIGPFIRFRFPLWTWFAFTALVAVELAFYLR